jgi:membrane fusion protein, multidrug efflux system
MISRRHAVWTTIVIAVVLAAVVAVALLIARNRQPGSKARLESNSIVEVRLAKAQVGTIRKFRDLAATVEPTRLARLASPAEGPVVRLLVREGDLVKAGQLLVVIGRNRTTRAKLLSDRGEFRRVQADFERVERLVNKGALAGELLDKAKADLGRAEAMVEAGEEVTSDFQIRAPWAGVVSQVLVQEGNYISPRAVLIQVFDPASLVLRIALPEAIALKVQRGAEARVRFDAFPEKEITGQVTRIYPELDRRLRTRVAEVSIDDGASLAPGMFARVRLAVEIVSGAVVVPAMAVVTTPKQEQAFFVVAEEVAHLRVGNLGIEEGNRVQVLSGVAAGEMVVVGGQQKLKDGVRVQIKAETPDVQKSPVDAQTNKATSKNGRP